MTFFIVSNRLLNIWGNTMEGCTILELNLFRTLNITINVRFGIITFFGLEFIIRIVFIDILNLF